MKTTASILLLLLLAFNWIGYRLLSVYLENKSEVALEKRIENADYDDSQLTELRVPLNAPYLSGNPSQFESFRGELELSGVHYKYVKRKVENGELVLLCLPDQNKTKFQNSRADFFKLVNDLNHSSQGKEKNTNVTKAFSSDYIQENNFLSVAALNRSSLKYAIRETSYREAGFINILKRPPKA